MPAGACMRTYWNHRRAIAYLAAADQRWKDILAREMNEALTDFLRHGKGSAFFDDFHWISRP